MITIGGLQRAAPGNPALIGGAAIITVVAAAAALAPWIAPHDPNAQNLALGARPPVWLAGAARGYVLGTDTLGRDLLSRILWGARVSVVVACSAVFIAGTLGVALGLVSGYAGGWLDEVITRCADIQLAIPVVLLAAAVVGVVGLSVNAVILTLGVAGWVHYVRVVRVEATALRRRDFVSAAQASGASAGRIVWRHLLPNIAPTIIVIATFEIARTMLFESALSFLGLGVPASLSSWGTLLADARQYLETAWWLGLFPGLAITVSVLGVSLFGDGLRDALDPRRLR